MLWFKHFTEAGEDLKLKRIKHSFGTEGYGAYWCILEMLAKETKATPDGYQTYHLNLNVYPLEFLGQRLGIEPIKFKSMVDLMVETELFDKEEYSRNLLCCSKLARIADDYTVRRVRTVYGQRTKSVRLLSRISSASASVSNISNKDNTIQLVGKELVSIWNLSGLSHVKELSSGRKSKLKERIKSEHFRQNWKAAVEKLSQSSFAKGDSPSGWKASIDWFLNNDTNYLKALEGKYDDKSKDRFAKY